MGETLRGLKIRSPIKKRDSEIEGFRHRPIRWQRHTSGDSEHCASCNFPALSLISRSKLHRKKRARFS